MYKVFHIFKTVVNNFLYVSTFFHSIHNAPYYCQKNRIVHHYGTFLTNLQLSGSNPYGLNK